MRLRQGGLGGSLQQDAVDFVQRAVVHAAACVLPHGYGDGGSLKIGFVGAHVERVVGDAGGGGKYEGGVFIPLEGGVGRGGGGFGNQLAVLEAHQLQDMLGQPESGAALAAEGEKFAGDVLEIGAVGAAFDHKGFFGGRPLLGGSA